MVIISINSVVLGTLDLATVRQFYESVLGLAVGRFSDASGAECADCDESYVNYYSGETVVGFESSPEVQRAELVLEVSSLDEVKAQLLNHGVTFEERKARPGFAFLRLADPEGRNLVIQQTRTGNAAP